MTLPDRPESIRPSVVALAPHSWCLLVRTDFTDDDDGRARVVEEATRPSPEGFSPT